LLWYGWRPARQPPRERPDRCVRDRYYNA